MHTQQSDCPLVSVAMGVLYRRDNLDYLKRSVSSILNQTYRNFECLICDDGSTFKAKRYLDECSRLDKRIILIRPEVKFDLASKLNACLREARGKYIARMDDDDYSQPERFRRQVDLLSTETSIAFVGSNVTLNRSGVACGERRFPEYPKVRDFYMTQPYIHPTLMFRKEALESVNGYSEDKRQVLCEDYDLLLRLYAQGYQGMNIQENLLEYTIPASGRSNRRMCHRWNETVTRWQRFRETGELPRALPFVVKPLAVGLIPKKVLLAARAYFGEA